MMTSSYDVIKWRLRLTGSFTSLFVSDKEKGCAVLNNPSFLQYRSLVARFFFDTSPSCYGSTGIIGCELFFPLILSCRCVRYFVASRKGHYAILLLLAFTLDRIT